MQQIKTINDLQKLIQNEIEESTVLEYKGSLQNKIQNGKKNWLKTLVRWLIPMEVLLYLE